MKGALRPCWKSPSRAPVARLSRSCSSGPSLPPGCSPLLLTEAVPGKTRVAFGVGIAFAIAWILYAARILRRGTYRRKSDSTTAAGMVFGFTITAALGFALVMRHRLDPFLMFGFLFVLPAAVILLRTAVEQSELRTQERILELEYRLARLSEGLVDHGGRGTVDSPRRP